MSKHKTRGKNKVITLLTDFGVKDSYVAEMKGVILRICSNVSLIDISHEIYRHNVLEGAFLLAQASPYFPEDSVHLAVIDPGVGTARRRIAIQGRRCIYVGPDNGVLSLAVEKEGIVRIVEIKNQEYMLPPISRTFEGRDIFASVAAYVAKGVDVRNFGPEICDYKSLTLGKSEKQTNQLMGNIIHIDVFGNLITNISQDMFEDIKHYSPLKVIIGNISKSISYYETYGDAPNGAPLLTIGSTCFLELAVNQGSARTIFNAEIGDKVSISYQGHLEGT